MWCLSSSLTTDADLITASMHMLQNHTSVSISSPGPLPPLMPGLSLSWGLVNLLVVTVEAAAVFLQNLTAQIREGLINIDTASGGSLVVGLGAPLLSQLERSCTGDYTILLHIALVANNHHGNVVVVLDANDLLSELGELVEGVHVGNGEDEQEAISLLHVELTHGRELVCACRVKSG